MQVLEVIPARRYRNTETGHTASIYGAHPAPGDPHWILETHGWTWKTDRGTIGLGRPVAATREEAISVMTAVNRL